MPSNNPEIIRVPIPKTRDPFVNTPPFSIGPGPDGRERFWASTYNKNEGSTGVVVTEDGDCRVYHLPRRVAGCESAAAENDHVLWLCDNLSFVTRLDLRTGKARIFETDAPPTPVFAGMALDAKAGKLLVVGKLQYEPIAVAFNIRRNKTAAIYRNAPIERMACSFRNPDGAWTGVSNQPVGLRWDPRRETLRSMRFCKDGTPGKPSFIAQHVADENGRVYLPYWGWFDPRLGKIATGGPRPDQECCWFARRGATAWGVSMRQDNVQIHRWDMQTGTVSPLCLIRDCHFCGVTASVSGKIIAVNMFGVFTRNDGQTGVLECSRVLPVEAVGQMDCICRIDRRRLLGTPYISQRFWTVDVRTKRGEDCGRAAPGVGEILVTCRIRGKIFMAAYTSGELMEYDPDRPARFPENPRVVAAPPESMRPVSLVHDDRTIWYICNKPYGRSGSVLTRFDTRTGLSRFANDPLSALALRTLWLERATHSLYAGSCAHADNYSAALVKGGAVFARFNADSLRLEQTVSAGQGFNQVWIVGMLGMRRLMAVHIGDDSKRRWAGLRLDPMRAPAPEDYRNLPVNSPPIYAGRPGFFIFVHDRRTELWDMRSIKRVRVLFKAPARLGESYRCVVQDRSIHLVFPHQVVILERVL